MEQKVGERCKHKPGPYDINVELYDILDKGQDQAAYQNQNKVETYEPPDAPLQWGK